MPDGFLGILSYSITAALAAMDGADRARRNPWIPLALAGKIGLDVAEASRLTWDQWAKHKAFCFWCLLSAVASYVMVPLVWNEARTALRHLRR